MKARRVAKPSEAQSLIRETDTVISKADYRLLEKCFEKEISAAINGGFRCYQSKSKRMEHLEGLGLVHRTEYKLGGRFPVTVSGWELTR